MQLRSSRRCHAESAAVVVNLTKLWVSSANTLRHFVSAKFRTVMIIGHARPK
jgi:hypothetical protein